MTHSTRTGQHDDGDHDWEHRRWSEHGKRYPGDEHAESSRPDPSCFPSPSPSDSSPCTDRTASPADCSGKTREFAEQDFDEIQSDQQSIAEDVGAVIGPYTLVEKLGEGGMGVIFRATQQTPVRREVALKLIKPGLDTRQVIRRFEAERQALAMMDHPNIARVLDAGSTAAGRPYFVMELVDGLPITTFCDRYQLTLTQRLNLFCELCEAIQHAHQKGIIHRDLKPSNVLIVSAHGRPLARVIDFGLAKALEQKLTDDTLWTHHQQVIGTPMYMSPEQAEPLGLHVDTRSDVYSLGVILYELLTGDTPFDRDEIRRASSEEVRRILQHRDPVLPSKRLASHRIAARQGDTLETLATMRATKPKQLLSMVLGDLDWIVHKSLDKDRERRYDSPRALADDIGRYLRSEPVVACPPSRVYQTRKFIRRNKGPLAMAAVLVSVLLVATIVSLLLAQEANRLRITAEQRTRISRQIAYSSDLRLASFSLQQGDCELAIDLLKRQVPVDGQRDLRGAEWQLLWDSLLPPFERYYTESDAGYFVCFSNDQQYIATCGESGRVTVFDGDSRRPIHHFQTSQGETNGIAFSPDSTRLASAGDDGTVKIWDPLTGELWLTIDAHDEKAYQVGFLQNGKVLVTAGTDPEIHLWDAETGERLDTLRGHHDDIEAIAVSPGETYLASVSRDHTARLWDLSQRSQVGRTWRLGERGAATCFSCDGRYVAFADLSGRAVVLETATSHQDAVPFYVAEHPNGIQSLTFFGPDHLLITGDNTGVIRCWEPATAANRRGVIETEPFQAWKAHQGRIYSLASAADKPYLVSIASDGEVRQWQAPDPRSATEIKPPSGRIELFAFLDKSQFIVIDDQGQTYLKNVNAPQLAEPLNVPAHPWTEAAALSPQQFLLVSHHGSRILTYDMQLRQVLHDRVYSQTDCNRARLALSPDRRRVVIARQTHDEPGLLIDVQTLQVTAEVPTGSGYDVAWQPGSSLVAITSHSDVHLWDADRKLLLKTLTSSPTPIQSLTFSHGGAHLAAAASDRSIRVWDMQSMGQRVVGRTRRFQPRALTFSPDDQSLLAADFHDGTVLAWRTASWRFVGAPFRTLHRPDNIRFSPDGRHLGILALDRNDGSQTHLWIESIVPIHAAAIEPAEIQHGPGI